MTTAGSQAFGSVHEATAAFCGAIRIAMQRLGTGDDAPAATLVEIDLRSRRGVVLHGAGPLREAAAACAAERRGGDAKTWQAVLRYAHVVGSPRVPPLLYTPVPALQRASTVGGLAVDGAERALRALDDEGLFGLGVARAEVVLAIVPPAPWWEQARDEWRASVARLNPGVVAQRVDWELRHAQLAGLFLLGLMG
ncbi:MAG: hypothetical protein IPM29_01770 [Planctomycetes bacterium]|nr:hypothetical protein [Planctomycetota bacterium]